MADTANRIFPFSYADLVRFCDSIHGFMERDSAEMLNFGISESIIEDFKSKINDFIDFPQDVALEAELVNATQNKNNLVNDLRIMLRSFALRAKLAFGENNGNYKRFHTKELSRISDSDLFMFVELVVEAANELLSEMASTGLTQDMIDELANKNNELRIAFAAQSSAIALRDDTANNRVKNANELYELLSRYCEIGKNIWYEVNEAKYNDYLIYGTGSGGSSSGGGGNSNAPAAPSNFRYDFAERMIRWNSVSGATSYSLESSMNNVDWEEIYQGEETEFYTGEILPEHIYLRIRTRNANGFSSFANLNIVYNLVLNGPTNLTHVPAMPGFTWNSVAGAMVYEVQLRDSTATDDDYINIYFGNSTQLYHADQVGTFYVRIRAWNNEGTSPWMLLAYQVNP